MISQVFHAEPGILVTFYTNRLSPTEYAELCAFCSIARVQFDMQNNITSMAFDIRVRRNHMAAHMRVDSEPETLEEFRRIVTTCVNTLESST